ncbi:uncharacterized protein LOC120414034 [Culex pipiens pallens]|uniref:uncharacterized protein LOC120414034 n=1 Tax=Culex pipiens pallens TaxID=42434 RepID=UPI0022AAA324|nr:uncharacterized protein LOC120414034 [Culex pipiens pallens]
MKITMARINIIKDFERIWDTNRTPPWFKEFPDVVADIYQTAREDVIIEADQTESEFNQQMFYHYYHLASVDCLRDDLHQTKNILNSCLERYDKIPQDDRNYALDELSIFVKEKLAEIDEDVSKHEPRLHGSSFKDYVEICLTLGNIENNNELLQQLKKCSNEDQKQLEQLLWCKQLVRLIITLEEEALNQTFHRISIPAENETCLARAYHLARHGNSSENHSKSVGTNQTSTQECVFYGGVKERVREKIYGEVVLRKHGLEQVKFIIQRDAGKELSNTDTVFVEDEFRGLCLEQCLEEMQHSMKSYLTSYQEMDIVKMFNFVEIVSTCNAIPQFFKQFHYFKELLKFKLSEEEESKLVENFKSTFVSQIINHCNAVQNELGFISNLTSYLSKIRKVKAVVNKLGVNEQTLNVDYEKLMTLKDSENNEELLELQSTVKSMMQQETQLIMKDKLRETILGFAEPVQVQRATVDDRTVVKVLGKHIVLGEILESVENELAIDMDITEVHFIGSKVFHIDADLVSETWHGKNVAVRSKLIQVHGTVVWDVSGKSCNRKYEPARSATVEGADGCAGEDGYPGESGGNVFITAEKMINCEEFTVISNGGDGSDGQDGGHGKKGRDGVGIKRENIEQEFNSPVRFLAFHTTRMEQVQRMIRSVDRNFVHSSQRFIQDSDTFIVATGQDSKGVIFSYCSPKLFQNNSHCYLVHKGSMGKPGGQGGDYGRGGEGGFPGQIIVKSVIGEIFQVNKSTVRGQDGRSGAAGLYGDTGDNGWDIGYLDYQTWRSAYYYGEDYKSKLTVEYHDDSRKESVWCWHKNKYASIKAVKSENSSVEKHKKRHFGKRDRKHSAVAVKKKMIIESSFIASTDQHFGSIDENALLSAYTRIERIRQRALQGVSEKTEQRKKANKRYRINHIIACPDIEHDIDEPPAKISNTVKQKAMSSKVFESILIRKESLINWKQLRFCRIENQDLQRLFLLLHSTEKEKTKLSANDFKIIEQILVDKQRLATFEEITDKIHINYSNTNKSVLSAQYASICLEEDPQQCGINCHNYLGKLDDYFFNFDCDGQQEKLSSYCNLYRKNLPSSVVEAFLYEAVSADSSIQEHLDQYKLVSELREFDSARNLNQFMKELIPSKFSNIINLWYLNDEKSSLAQKLIHEIDYDYRLGSLRKHYMKELNKEINFNQCLQNDLFFETYQTFIVEKGPLTRSYRELLAYAFGVNIQVYIRVPSGKFLLRDSHNSESSDILYLLLENESFVKLRLNENLMNLENYYRILARRYALITDRLMSFKDKQSFDEYVSNGLYLYCDFVSMNDVRYLCNTELLNELVQHFSFGERHVIEAMFTRSDVSSFVYSKLLRNLCLRFAAEGKHISTDEVQFLVNRYLVASSVGRHEEEIVSWIVLAFPQASWVSEILLLDLERYYKERLARKSEWRILLKKVENKALMILFSAKLQLSLAGTVEPIDKMERILKMMSMAKHQTTTLLKLNLSEWYYVLEEHYWVEKLKPLTSWNDNETLQEASYYAVALLNNYSLEIMEKFFNTIKGKNASENHIIDVLCSVYNGRWNFTEENIANLEKIKLEQWIKNMDSNMSTQQERDINVVVQFIKDNKWASFSILSKLQPITKQVQFIKEEIDKRNRVFRNLVPYLYNRLRERFPGAENSNSTCFSDKRVEQQLLDIDDAIYEEFKFRLRDTQKFVVLTLLENNKNTLAQVSTGEGKSLIVVAVAIIKASQGQKVDIITSSSVLARRDAELSKSIYAKFGINVSHNCSEDIEKRKEAYSGNQVVYGDLSSFQRDYLLHKFYQNNVIGDRNFENVIVDEVDSMLLDRGNNMLYLSHDLPDMDKLESVYVFIWEWVNNISKVHDTAAIRDAVLWQLYGVLKCTDIGKIDATLSEEKRNFIWNKLVEAKIIDGDGKLMTENIKNDVLGELLGSEYSVYLDRLEYLLTEYINREKCIHVPNYLRSFVDLHLESWIEAAKMALVMEAGHDYVVDVDRSGSSADRTPNITILDRDTGTDLVNSQWEAALHQFVQLKHGCKTYLQSLKAVFISNVTFLKLYDKLYGLSGTLGSQRERDLLEEIYAVDFVNVPTAKCKLFYEYVPIVCKSAADWIDTINESAKRLTETDGRSVLIICETLNEVAELYKEFGGKKATNVRTYTREYEEFDTGELSPGQIIIATNLAGRGTDIKLTQKLKGAGGVHVCLTYLPSNIRVEQQAFGRAARCGDRGSGQLIVLDQKEILNIMLLKRQRDTRELARISLIKKHYETRVVLEENCFKQFTHQFDELRNLLTASKITNGNEELSDILLGSCLDRWVFWLDNNGKNLVSNAKHHSRKKLDISLADFLSHLKSLKVTNLESLLDWVDISTPRMIKLGRYFIENKQAALAHTLFDKVIAAEPQFCEAALYYKAYALSTKITWNVVNSPEVKTFSHTLRSAADMFEERVQNLMINVSRVDKIKTKLKHNILPITAYKEQKQIICKFYGALTQSVNDILGHPVSATSFEFGDTIDKSRSIEIFNALQAKKIVQNPIIKDNISEKELRDISYNYGTSAAKLLNFLEKCRTTQGRSVQLEKFVRLLKEQVILPSREGFWRHLVEQEILSKKEEEKYILVDKTKLSVKDIEYFDSMLSLPGLKTKVTIKEGELLLYPDQLLDGDAYNKDPFKKAVGPAKYATFKELGAISFQRKAKFNLDKLKTKQVNFNHYDSISLEDFAMVNISQNDANGILDLLVRGKVLQKQDGNKELYKLHTDGSRINGIQLGEYKIYEDAVRGLLNLCFCYRIAYQSITRCANNGRAQDFPLISKPHRRILADLLHARILEPAVSRLADIGDLRKALSGIRLEEDSLVKVAQRLKSLKGSMDSLRMVPFSEYDRYTNVEEWNLFSLNGNELLLKLRGASFMKIVGTFLWGALLIRAALVQNIKTRRTELSRRDLSKYSTGWQYICSAIRMAFDVYGTDYYKLKYNKFIKRVALIEATNFGFFGDRLNKFAFEVTQPATSKPDIKYVRKLAVPLIRGFDLVSRTANVQLLIDDRLKLMCAERSDCLLSSIDKNAAFSAFEECLKKLFSFMDVDEARKKLIKLTEMHLQRQQYFKNIEAILVKVADTVLQALSRATKRPNVHITVSTILSVDINDAWVTALKDNERNLAMIVTNIVQELTGKLNLLIAENSVEDQTAITGFEGFVEEAIMKLKAQLHEKLDVLLKQTIHRPVQERGRFLLLNYAEGQIELQTDSNDGPNPGEDIAKKIRIGQLKKESDQRRQALAMTPVENLLDQQFNEALAKWEQSTTELERLAVCIRKGEPVDGQYLDICLDSSSYILFKWSLATLAIWCQVPTQKILEGSLGFFVLGAKQPPDIHFGPLSIISTGFSSIQSTLKQQ